MQRGGPRRQGAAFSSCEGQGEAAVPRHCTAKRGWQHWKGCLADASGGAAGHARPHAQCPICPQTAGAPPCQVRQRGDASPDGRCPCPCHRWAACHTPGQPRNLHQVPPHKPLPRHPTQSPARRQRWRRWWRRRRPPPLPAPPQRRGAPPPAPPGAAAGPQGQSARCGRAGGGVGSRQQVGSNRRTQGEGGSRQYGLGSCEVRHGKQAMPAQRRAVPSPRPPLLAPAAAPHLKLLASSLPATNSSKRSTTPGRLRCGLACGKGRGGAGEGQPRVRPRCRWRGMAQGKRLDKTAVPAPLLASMATGGASGLAPYSQPSGSSGKASSSVCCATQHSTTAQQSTAWHSKAQQSSAARRAPAG